MRFALLIAALLLSSSTFAQQPHRSGADNSRGFWPPEFRPPAAQPKAKASTGRYKPVHATRMPAQPATLGLTLWLLNPTKDETARGLVRVKRPDQPEAPTELMVAKRAAADTTLKIGQRLLLSVEVPQAGYLYIIDREKFADSFGKPMLIFPYDPQGTEHRVNAGRVIEVPDSQYYLEVRRVSTETHQPLIGELLTFIVTPEPLQDLPPAPTDKTVNYFLPPALVAGWEAAWQKNFQQLELVSATGQPRSLAEQEASTRPDRPLTRKDPLPQTVFQVAAKRGSPFIVQMSLTIGK